MLNESYTLWDFSSEQKKKLNGKKVKERKGQRIEGKKLKGKRESQVRELQPSTAVKTPQSV